MIERRALVWISPAQPCGAGVEMLTQSHHRQATATADPRGLLHRDHPIDRHRISVSEAKEGAARLRSHTLLLQPRVDSLERRSSSCSFVAKPLSCWCDRASAPEPNSAGFEEAVPPRWRNLQPDPQAPIRAQESGRGLTRPSRDGPEAEEGSDRAAAKLQRDRTMRRPQPLRSTQLYSWQLGRPAWIPPGRITSSPPSRPVPVTPAVSYQGCRADA